MRHAYANYFDKVYNVSCTKNAKKEFHRFIPGKAPLKLKKITQKIYFNPVPAASTAGPGPTITGLLLRFYNNVQTEWQLCRP